MRFYTYSVRLRGGLYVCVCGQGAAATRGREQRGGAAETAAHCTQPHTKLDDGGWPGSFLSSSLFLSARIGVFIVSLSPFPFCLFPSPFLLLSSIILKYFFVSQTSTASP